MTNFPNSIDTFPEMMDLLVSDGILVKQYQDAMSNGDLMTAKQILEQIPDNQNKIITADYLNNINDALIAMEKYTAESYSPAYIVSAEQPIFQKATDFWFQVLSTEAV